MGWLPCPLCACFLGSLCLCFVFSFSLFSLLPCSLSLNRLCCLRALAYGAPCGLDSPPGSFCAPVQFLQLSLTCVRLLRDYLIGPICLSTQATYWIVGHPTDDSQGKCPSLVPWLKRSSATQTAHVAAGPHSGCLSPREQSGSTTGFLFHSVVFCFSLSWLSLLHTSLVIFFAYNIQKIYLTCLRI